MSQSDAVTLLLPTFTVGQRKYRLTSLGYSSERFGVCEVCKKHVSDVHYQVEEQYYHHVARADYPGHSGWTHSGCHSYFGHEECLRGKRRGELAACYRDPLDQRDYDVYSGPADAPQQTEQTTSAFHVRAVASFYVEGQFTDIRLRTEDSRAALRDVALELTKVVRDVREVDTSNPYTALYEFRSQEGSRFSDNTESGFVLLSLV